MSRFFIASRFRNVSCLGLLFACVPACEAHDRVLPFRGDAAFSADAAADGGMSLSDADIRFDSALPDRDGSVLPGDAGDAQTAGGRAADPECDMNGLWMVKQLTRSEALALGQFANYWYFFELAQDGENVTVVSQMDCDIHVEGSVTVTLTMATRRSLMAHNTQRTRRGTMRRQDETHCALAFERFWSVRGGDEARFTPVPRSSTESVDALRMRLPLPTAQATDGAEDWDNDGQLGIAWQITGIANGTRNTVQRDVTEWFTDDRHGVVPARDFRNALVLRSRFDNDENVIHATSSLVGSLAVADQTAEHRVTFSFLGRDASDPRAQAILATDPFVTCERIIDAMPFENSL